MNPEFKVLTNVNESNLRQPIIQNRFRKLTLQSPKQTTTPLKLPEPLHPAQPKLTVEKIVDPAPVSPLKSQTETITNKLMLSSSSGNNTEQTNFINVETEPFTNPLRVESAENEDGSPKNASRNSNNNDLASQMKKLDVSKGSVELFSQFSSSTKLSIPRNRILSNKENIENISQRISNIRMTDHDDLADTQPNTSSQGLGKSQVKQTLADTQLNSSPIVLSSDGEDSNDDNDNDNENLLTEESEEDNSVIEILSDSSFEITDDRVPQNVSPINGQPEDITESVQQKLNHFFDNIPDLNVSHLNYSRNVDSNTSKNESLCSEINVSETAASQNENAEESNILQLQASQLDENLDKSGKQSSDRNSSQIDQNEKDGNLQNETLNSSANKAEETSLHLSRNNDSDDKSSAVDNEESVHSEISPAKSSHQNQNTDETQMSIYQPSKRNEKIKATCNNVMTLNSPIINISAKVNINIRLSGFSSSTTSSDTDGTSENADDPSEVSSKDNDTMPSEKSADSSREFVGQCKQNSFNSKQYYVNNSVKHDATDDDDDDDNDPHKHNSSLSTGSSDIIESSLIQSQGDGFEEIQNDEIEISGIRELVDTVKELTVADDAASTTNQIENDFSVPPVETSVEIDEIGEQLLTDIYGDAWRTPQLIKKCVSTKKKCLTEVPKRNLSLGFSFFKRDVPSELESTRITPCGAERDISKELDQSEQQLLDVSNEQVNEAANESSRIIRTHRKVAVNRILDYTDESGDETDGNKSNSDTSFEPVKSSDEDSDTSVEKFVKPKRKRNKFVFLDLTCDEVIEDEDHESPDASAEELEKVCENFLQSLQTETIVQTPVPTKKTVPSSTTKRKLFTHNYDDQIPFEETKTPSRSPKNDNEKTIQQKTIHLKTPIPSYLIPPQFRDKTNAEVIAKPIAHPSTSSKRNESPRTPAWPVSSQICGFLESLDDQLIPVEHCHPDALKFRTKFEQIRDALVARLMKIFNDQVFDNKLKGVPVTWSNKLTSTAGYCRNRKIGGVRKCAISLSGKLLTSPGRVRDTLIHELCHAATWIVDGDSGGHGKVWKYWTERANKRIPVLPKIERCHNYEVLKKYTYKCTLCGLKSLSRSKSKKVENIRCSKCHGPIEVFMNQQDKDGKVTLVPPKEPSTFAMYVKENYKFIKTSGVTHADVMKILSNNFGKLTVEEKNKYKN